MSKENLEQFMNKVAESEELQYRLDEGGKIDAEALIALGAECGCEFTAEELQEAAELSDEELEGVAGGLISKPGQVLTRAITGDVETEREGNEGIGGERVQKVPDRHTSKSFILKLNLMSRPPIDF